MQTMLSDYTSLHVGGRADVTVITDVSQLAAIKNPTVLGRGSKILASDGGVGGKVVVMRTSNFSFNGGRLTAESGCTLPILAQAAASLGLSGLEWACGIPGSLGGGIVMNAGAFSGSIADILESVTVYGYGEIARSGLDMNYRRCQGLAHGVITRATLRLTPAQKVDIKAKMREYAYRRSATQPGGASAGSTFRRCEGQSAGAYIEQAGLKGQTCGGGSISQKHANFIINDANAKASDIRKLVDICKIRVKRVFGVSLEEEMIYLGEF